MNLTFHHVKLEAEGIYTYFFRPERPLRYVAGQFVEITIPHDNPDERGVRHWFTLSSAPGHELVTITTRHSEPSSTFKLALLALAAGDEVQTSEPMGDFVLPKDPTQPLVFIAGGIGITPYHSIVEWLLDSEQMRPIQLLYSVKQQQDIIFRPTFNQPWITKQVLVGQPSLTTNEIVKLVDGIDGKQVFISGPEPMTEAIVEQFKQLGLTQDQLITDYFPGYAA